MTENTPTPNQIKKALQESPEFLITFVVRNNLAAVNENLRSAGLISDSATDSGAYQIIWNLIQTGQGKLAQQIISVPLDEQNIPEGYRPILEEIVREQAEQASRQGMQQRISFGAVLQGLAAGLGAFFTAQEPGPQTTEEDAPPSKENGGGEPSKKDNTVWWIVGIAAGLLLLVVILILGLRAGR